MTADITMYGADWCGDCRRAKALFESLDVQVNYIDLVAEPEQADTAKSISGRTNIPVIVYSDGSHHVEPSNDELVIKLAELGKITGLDD